MKKFLVILSILSIALCVSDSAIVSELLELHNAERSMIGLAGVTWSSSIASTAQSWSDSLAASNSFKHSGTKGVGENIAKASNRANVISVLVGMWSKEKKNFVNNKPYPDCRTGSGKIGHYTQMIWSKTTQIGCGVSETKSSTILVCQYKTSGNFIGNWVYTEADIVKNPGQPQEPEEPTEDPVEEVAPEDPEEEPLPGSPADPEADPTEVPTENEFAHQLLTLHNAQRKEVGVPELTWNTELEDSAQDWAEYIARRGRITSSDQRDLGENIAKEESDYKEDMVEYMFNTWASQKRFFNNKKRYPYCSTKGSISRVSAYTQIIWNDTKEVGCGMAQGSKSTYLVCHYKGKGNRNGYYVYPSSGSGRYDDNDYDDNDYDDNDYGRDYDN